ncbi:MAG: putative repeat protein (TIGR01451 family), partial [Myxococcota bacterium]
MILATKTHQLATAAALVVALICVPNASACTSLADGDWHNVATWDCANVPTASDAVGITAGHTITISADGVAQSLTIEGELSVTADTVLDVLTTFTSTTGTTVMDGGLTINGTGATNLGLIDGAHALSVNAPTISVNARIGDTTPVTSITFTGAINLNIAGPATSADTSVTSTGAILLDGATTVQQHCSIRSEGGLTATSTIDGPQGIILVATSGSPVHVFSGNVGATIPAGQLQVAGPGTVQLGMESITGSGSSAVLFHPNIVLTGSTPLLTVTAANFTAGFSGARSLRSDVDGAQGLKVTATTIELKARVGDNSQRLASVLLLGPVTAGPEIRTTGTQTYGDTLTGTDLVLEAGNINFSGGADSVSGTGTLTITNQDNANGIKLAAGAGATFISLSATDMAALADGWAQLKFGDTGDNGVIDLAAAIVTDPVSLTGSNIIGNSLNAGSNAITLNGSVRTVSGVFTGETTVNGEVSPAGPAAIGSVSFDGGLTLDGTDTVVLGVTNATVHDTLSITGALTLGGAALDLTLSTAVAVGDQVVVISNDGVDAISGTFDGLAEGASVAGGPASADISYVGGDGNDVVLTVTCGTNNALCPSLTESCIANECATIGAPTEPCDTGDAADCVANSACITSACACNGGFTALGGVCVENAAVDVTLVDALLVDSKTPGAVNTGDTIRYTVRVPTTGADAIGANFGVTLDANVSLVAGSVTTTQGSVTTGNTGGDTTVAINLGTITEGDNPTITVDVIVNNALTTGVVQISTVAAVTGSNFTTTASDDPDTVAAGDATITPLQRLVDLVVVKGTTASALSFEQAAVWEILYENAGDETAALAVLTETVPTHMEYDATGGDTWVCAGGITAGNTCTFALGSVVSGGSGSVDFGTKLSGVLGAALSTTNLVGATHTSGVPEANASDNEADDSVTLDVNAQPVLAVSIKAGSATPLTLSAGGGYTVNAAVNNLGGRSMNAFTYSVGIPAGVSASVGATGWTCPQVAGPVTCTFLAGVVSFKTLDQAPALPITVDSTHPAGRDALTFTVDGASDGGHHSGTPVVAAQANVQRILTAAPDLVVTVTAGAPSPAPAIQRDYDVTVTNVGSQGATGMTVSFVVPAGSSVTGAIGFLCLPNTSAGSTCEASPGTDSLSSTVSLTFLDAAPAGVETIALTVTATDDGNNGTDETPGDNSATKSDALDASPDLAVSLDAPVSPTAATDTALVDITTTNTGDQNASGVTLSITVPEAMTFDGTAASAGWVCTDGGAAGGVCTLPIGNVNVGQEPSRTAAFKVDNTVPAGLETVSTSFEVDDDNTSGTDSDPGNDALSANIDIDALPELVVTKSDGGTTTAPGANLAYTVTVGNTGRQDASGVVATETVPAYSTFVATAVPWTCQGDGGPGDTCTLSVGTVGGLDSEERIFTVKIDDSVPSGVSQTDNTVTAVDDLTGGFEADTLNNLGTDSTPIVSEPNLHATITGGTATPGETLTLTIGATNDGNQDANGVNVTVTVPANTQYAGGGGWSCPPGSISGTTCVFSIGLLAVEDSTTTTFPLDVESPLSAGVLQISTTATVSDDGLNGNANGTADDSTTLDTPVAATPVLTVQKRDGGAAATPGNTVVYAIDYSNDAIATQHAQGVQLIETVPAFTTFNALSSTPGWSCVDGALAGTECIFALATVNVGATGSVSFAVSIDVNAPPDTLSNTIRIDDDGQNGAGAIATATATTTADITPCHTDYLFDGGTGPWTTDNPALWEYVPSLGAWKTGGLGTIPNGKQIGRVNLDVVVPTLIDGGPRPELLVTYELQANPNPNFDGFSVCLDDDDCTGQTPTNVFNTKANTTGFQVASVSLADYVGTTVRVSLLFDTITTGNPGGVDGLTITAVRLASDPEGDGFDGSAASCDRCYDGDADDYVNALSPGIGGGECVFDSDCDDDNADINPGALEICTVGTGDEDCDGFTNGLDEDCGTEDCADGIDNNEDGAADCFDEACVADPICADECSVNFTFNSGPGGWLASDNDPDGDGNTQVFEHGKSATHGGEVGWSTVQNGDVGTANTTGAASVVGRLVKPISVLAGTPSPVLELRYSLQGEGTNGKDVLGVCFNTSPAQCNASAPAATTAFRTSANTGPTLTTALIELPEGSGGSVLNVVIFYDTVDGANNANPGAFIGDVLVRSDRDNDGIYEAGPPQCDHCVDADSDGFGDPTVASDFRLTCANLETDCADNDGDTSPGPTENCAIAGDNNCDGLEDVEDETCSICSDDLVTAGEQCDDGNLTNDDGCDSDCQVEAGAFHITELHLTPLGGGAGEQWFELYNASSGPVDLVQLGLVLESQTGAQEPFATNCAARAGKSTVIAPQSFYVIALGQTASQDGLDSDAECSGSFQLSSTGDILRLRDSDGAVVDQVDFRSFDCELEADLVDGKSRSFELIDAVGQTAASNDGVSAWCLIGDSAPVTSTLAHLGSPHTQGACAEFFCDGADDDCDGDTDELLDDADVDGFCDEVDCDPLVPT